jgi:hypothetical protein
MTVVTDWAPVATAIAAVIGRIAIVGIETRPAERAAALVWAATGAVARRIESRGRIFMPS